MFSSSLDSTHLWNAFLNTQPVFRESMRWIQENAETANEGIYELGEPGWFVNVHGYSTQPEALCSWENHPATIDIQYLIAGAEGIDVLPVTALAEAREYKKESDTQKFDPIDQPATRLVLRAGDLVIFLPGEAHRPKVAIGEHTPLRKLVVKIPSVLCANCG